MGWYHAKQIIEKRVPRTVLSDIVDPFMLGEGKDTPYTSLRGSADQWALGVGAAYTF